MKRFLIFLFAISVLGMVIGCSDDDGPTGTTNPDEWTAGTTLNAADGYYESLIDGSDTLNYAKYNFDSLGGVSKAARSLSLTDNWHIAFRRTSIILNGGSSSEGSSVVGADLGVVDFSSVTIADTAGVEWIEDEIDYIIDDFYIYTGPPNHDFLPTKYVYSMLDATGEHYVKFRVDSMVNLGMGSLGDVYITYYYQDTISSPSLAGATSEAMIRVGDSAGYFDFSAGAEVFPADPAALSNWDIEFTAYNIAQNTGPNGPGSCAAFPAYGEMTDGTDIDAFTAQPAEAPMFPDVLSSAMLEWYEYDGETHQLPSKGNVYLVNTGNGIYKMKIETYYGLIDGSVESGLYTFHWIKL